jgi:L-seryl-tRNA(Ser) seleniumtransferase
VPVLRMLTAGESELRARAESMRERIAAAGVEATVMTATAKVGGGALPLLELEGPVCAVDPGPLGVDELSRRLRRGDPPVVARARDGWLVLDPRTLDDAAAGLAATAVVHAFR